MTPCALVPTFQRGLLLHLQDSPRTVSCTGKMGIAQENGRISKWSSRPVWRFWHSTLGWDIVGTCSNMKGVDKMILKVRGQWQDASNYLQQCIRTIIVL